MNKYDVDKEVVVIYFSFNRPLQLDLTLKSNHHNCEESNYDEFVIYKSGDEKFEKAYSKLKSRHQFVRFIKETNFKQDLLFCLQNKKYVVFVVDDCIFTNNYSLVKICGLMEQFQNVLGFSLRLGKNTKVCYPINQKNQMPVFIPAFGDNTIMFDWTVAGNGDFAYPLEVSSSLYRIGDLLPLLENCDYDNPNSLEWIMACNTNYFQDYSYLACYETSVAFCDPINKVQNVNHNRAGSSGHYSPEMLLKIFEEGGKIDYSTFDGFVSNGCHQEVDLNFLF